MSILLKLIYLSILVAAVAISLRLVNKRAKKNKEMRERIARNNAMTTLIWENENE